MNNYEILICCYGIKVELIEKPIYHIVGKTNIINF